MRRRFVILGHTQQTTAPLPLNDPAGAAGRWDILARFLTSSLLVSHGLRRDVEAVLVLGKSSPPRLVRVDSGLVKSLNPDERSTLALLSKALGGVDVGAHETSVHPGIFTRTVPLGAALNEWAAQGEVVLLSEGAETRISGWKRSTDVVTFVLGDHRDPSSEEQEALRAVGCSSVTLGPLSLQADQCVSVIQNRLDDG